MKTRKEVELLTGVSRKALQIYNKKGLLQPAAKTEAGYWLYDDQAIDIIKVIQLFQEAGYELNEIKTTLESSDLSFLHECEKIITALTEKRKELDGKLFLAKFLYKAYDKINTDSILIDVDPRFDFRRNKVITIVRNLCDTLSNLGNNPIENYLWIEQLPYIIDFIMIGNMADKPVDSSDVQNTISSIIQSMTPFIASVLSLRMQLGEKIESVENEVSKLLWTRIPDQIEKFLSSSENQCLIASILGDKAPQFILDAIQAYCSNKNGEHEGL